MSQAPALRRVLRVRDLVFFYVTAVLGMRWVATAAAAGPGALLIWVLAALSLFVPLAFTVIELSSRYPDEGGIYVWTKHAFGEFGGFLTGWTYWGSNLTYLPGLLYFGASTALYIFGDRYLGLQSNSTYFIAMSLAGLAIATLLNVRGLEVGKWFATVGAIATWVPLVLLIVLGFVAAARSGAATPLTMSSLIPTTGLREMVFWSTIAFAFTGLEAGSFMGDEIVDPRRSIPRAIWIAGLSIALLYILGTLAILLALPQAEITGLGGIMDALVATGKRIGIAGLAPLIAVLIVLNNFGGVGVWLAAPARLLFVAGIDRFLPASFGRLHPKYGTPHRAILLQGVIAAACAIMGQAGETPKRAYDILVSISVASFFLPYIAMFAAMIRLQREPAGPEVVRVPGGRPVATALGVLGLATSVAAVILACIPPPDEVQDQRYVIKVVGLTALLLLSGAVVYGIGKMGRRTEASA